MQEDVLLEELKSDVSSEVGEKDLENPLNSTKVKLKGYLLKKIRQEERDLNRSKASEVKPKREVRAKNHFQQVHIHDGGALWRQDRKWMYQVNPTYKKFEQKYSETDRLMLERRREQRSTSKLNRQSTKCSLPN